ncbi:MAG: hypothetical protein ACFFEA_06000 [Candidatus Thorarchaeota archaeon]
MVPDRILRAYEQLEAAQLSSECEISSIIAFEEERVRIVLTKDDDIIYLEVEISGPSLPMLSGENGSTVTDCLKEAALRSVELLEYIIKLADNGFSLFLMDSEFLWTASIALEESPKETVLELLQPPGIIRQRQVRSQAI